MTLDLTVHTAELLVMAAAAWRVIRTEVTYGNLSLQFENIR